MLRVIAPTLTRRLTRKQLVDLESIRKLIEVVGESSSYHEAYVLFTDHSVRHSEAVLRNADAIVTQQDKQLTPAECYALIAACYLHDIGLLVGDRLLDERGQLPIQCWPHDVRQQHNILSEEIVRNVAIERQLKIKLPRMTEPMRNLIAFLCRIHRDVGRLGCSHVHPTRIPRGTRPVLLGAILVASDELHVGRSRVILKNLHKGRETLSSRLFWYSNWCIEDVSIVGATVRFTFGFPERTGFQAFGEYVVQPVIKYFEKSFAELAGIFEAAGWRPLKVDHEITCHPEDENDPDVRFSKIFGGLALTEQVIRDRTDARKERIKRKLKEPGLIRKGLIDSEFVALRRWSSYTPRMPAWNSTMPLGIPGPEKSRGGGYFLIWKHKGIAIDPGYDFLRNFWTQEIVEGKGFEIEDIHAVIVSHAHDDHSHDIEPILSLLYKKKREESKETADKQKEEDAAEKRDTEEKHRKFPIYCSEGTHIKYERLFSINEWMCAWDLVPVESDSQSNDARISPVLLPKEESFLHDNGIRLEYIRTDHNELPWMRNNTGVAIKLHLDDEGRRLKIGYTSDTRYFDGLVDFFRDVDLLVMHFGNMGPTVEKASPFDKNHLGMNGCHELLSALSTSSVQLFLLDEFGEEEVGNDRISLCRLLAESCGLADAGKTLLPIDIGLRVQLQSEGELPAFRVWCQEQNHGHYVSHDQIVPHLPPGGDGIVYFCRGGV